MSTDGDFALSLHAETYLSSPARDIGSRRAARARGGTRPSSARAKTRSCRLDMRSPRVQTYISPHMRTYVEGGSNGWDRPTLCRIGCSRTACRRCREELRGRV